MPTRKVYFGIGLAVLATLIWSGNFIVARGVIKLIPPVQLAFYRWLCASILIFPFAFKYFRKEWNIVRKNWRYILWAALTGVTLFNTLVYFGAHHTTAINLSLIGTTTSPIFAIIFAKIFLREPIGFRKLAGMVLCVAGVAYLLLAGSGGAFQFNPGDVWVVSAALAFAVYNTLVRRKPAGISPVNFLFVVFTAGTLLLFPFYLWELSGSNDIAVAWSTDIILIILYLGLGASVISFLCWNMAIGILGAGRTALFGNLIPVFSIIEASIILREKLTGVHIASMILVFAGIMLANWKTRSH